MPDDAGRAPLGGSPIVAGRPLHGMGILVTASAKAAIDQLCRVAASELGPSNVRVNVVRPGLVQVDRQELPGEIERDFRSAVVLPRLGCPADIADVVSFLASPRATWITGQVISVDGGQTISRPFDASPWVEPVYGRDGMRGVV